MADSPERQGEVEIDVPRLFTDLGRRARELRKAADFTQGELATAMGVSRTTIVNLEAGRQHPPLTTLYKLAAKLGVQLGDILPAVEAVASLQEVATQAGMLPPKAAAALQESWHEGEEGAYGYSNERGGRSGS